METSVIHLPWKRTEIILCGDIHWGTPECEKEKFKQFVRHHKNAHWWLLGDTFDLAPTGNRKKIRSSGLNDGVLDFIEESHLKDIKELYDVLDSTTIEGIIAGNHYWQFESGSTSDTVLADMLGCKYLGDCAMVVIHFQMPHRKATLRIFMHHKGAVGRKVASSLNRLQDLVAEHEADIYVTAHGHKSPQAPIDRLYVDDAGQQYFRTKRLLSVGSWYQSYLQHSRHGGRPQGGYPEKNLQAPSSLGCPSIIVKPRSDGKLIIDIGQESEL